MEMVNLSGGDPPRLRAESPSTPLPSSLLLLFQILIIAFIQKMSTIHQVLLGSSKHTLSLSLLAILPSRGDSIHFKDGETETWRGKVIHPPKVIHPSTHPFIHGVT